MALKIQINTNRYPWTILRNLRVTGFIRVPELLAEGEAFIDRVMPHTATFREFSTWCGHQNGQFSIIVQKEDEIWLSCSHTWSYPLFYVKEENVLAAGDMPGELIPLTGRPVFDDEAKLHFLNFSVTPGEKTLVKGIFQVRPGETIRLNGPSPEHELSQPGGSGSIRAGTPDELADLLRKAFSGYAAFLKDKDILLPLTRGYDSRLLACLLKESGLTRVTCATWGRPSNSEVATAREVAGKLEFPHHFIPYSLETIHRYAGDKTFNLYIPYAGHWSSMPFMQDYFAVRHLLEKNIIGQDTVVLPGHPGDFIRGSHLYPALPCEGVNGLAGAIISIFGNSYPAGKSERTILQKVISERFRDEKMTHSGLRKFDQWDYEERQCKLIGNSSLVYDFFGLRHMEPLFDRNVIDRFLQLPFGQRMGSSLYNETVVSQFFKPHGCDMDLKSTRTPSPHHARLKEAITAWAPRFLKKLWYPLNDDVFYREITRELMHSGPEKRYKHPRKPHYYNCYLSQWYLGQVQQELKICDDGR